MKKHLSLYLAGAIQKGHELSNGFFWTDEDMRLLRADLQEYEVAFLNPSFRTDDLSDQRSVFGRDMTQVFCSDVVLVDARERRGLGVGAEMMWAKVRRVPVVAWAPKNSHYRKDKALILNVEVRNFVHPFVESLSDAVVGDLKEAAYWARRFKEGLEQAKGVEFIESAMRHYQTSQLSEDAPMQALLKSNPNLLRLSGAGASEKRE